MWTSKKKVPHTYKEIIRIIITFRYENLLLLKSPQNNVTSNTAITEKKQSKSGISFMSGALWDKVIDFTDEPAVQCDVLAVKNNSLDDNDNDECK